MKTAEVKKLVTYIEENLRASPSAGLAFVDARHYRTRLLSEQNHVVFGRRGAGKTSLVSSVRGSAELIDIYLNLEDYKDITFPNVVIRVLMELLAALECRVTDTYCWFHFWQRGARKVGKEIRRTRAALESYLHEPDEETQEISEKESYQQEIGASLEHSPLAASGKQKRGKALEVKRRLPRSKIDYLRIELTSYKRLVQSVSDLLEAKPVFLVMDDFYFLPKETQPEFVDYFHRLTKGTSLFLKIATIKHRSKLYRRRDDQYIGVELGHDVFEVDMDYTLDNFDELQAFMRQLLSNAIQASSADIQLDEMFAGDGFSQLCLASGGVPRDFLALFVRLADQAAAGPEQIGKMDVTRAAISSVASKRESIKKDSADDDLVLEDCLNRIKRYVYDDRRTNSFLIAKDDLDDYPNGRQVIRELVDLRLIHLLDNNTSKAPSDGRRYEAYLLDIGLYDNPRPRNFTQVDPGQRDERARKDAMRASPVFNLSQLTGTRQIGLTLSHE